MENSPNGHLPFREITKHTFSLLHQAELLCMFTKKRMKVLLTTNLLLIASNSISLAGGAASGSEDKYLAYGMLGLLLIIWIAYRVKKKIDSKKNDPDGTKE